MMKSLKHSQQKNLRRFLDKYIPVEDRLGFNDLDEEIRIRCPFCQGGRSREYCFDFNIEKGVGRCWRMRNCAWKGNSFKLIMDLVGVDFPTALEIINGDEGYNSEEMEFLIERSVDKIDAVFKTTQENPTGFNVVPDLPTCELYESPLLEDILHWIEHERGYDPTTFLSNHDIFVPAQIAGGEGKIGFRVYTEDNVAYQLYKFCDEGYSIKTDNPDGKVLSRMIYNYNNVLDEESTVFICEGIFDCARLISWGLSAVCIFGVNIQDYQIYLLSKLKCSEIIIYLDYGTKKEKVLDIHKNGVRKDGMLRRISEGCPDKDVTFLEITEKDKDPDETTTDKFLEYMGKRVGLIRSNNANKLLSRLDKMDFL